jgi:hypothetical protein
MNLEQQLRAALAPCRPETTLWTVVLARVAANATRSRRSRRQGRVILFGAIVVVAAAAAPFVMQYFGTGYSGAADVVSEGVAETVVVSSEVTSPREPLEPDPQTLREQPVPEPQVSAPPALPVPLSGDAAPVAVRTVQLMSLQNQATDEASRAAVDLFFASFANGLRSIPGVTLIDADPAGSLEMVAEFRLTIRGMGPMRGDDFSVSVLEGVRELPDGTTMGARLLVNAVGMIAPACIDSANCSDPVNLAALMVDRVLKRLELAEPHRSPEGQ